MKPTEYAATDHPADFAFPSSDDEQYYPGMNVRTWMAGQVASGTGYAGMATSLEGQADHIVRLADAILERLQTP